MRAVVYETYGPPDVLRAAELDRPALASDEILIRVRAAEVTKADCELRSFRFPVKWFWLPLRIALGIRKPRRKVLGGYFAGEVAAIGERVTRFVVGDAVFGCAQLRLGAHAEYVSLPESFTIAPKPATMSFEEAAAVPLGGLNAIHFMRRANIRSGERVLVNGAGGSIGIYAVQIAKTMGAEVTAVDAAIKEPMLRQLGADHFVDYAIGSVFDRDERYDVIFDMVARSSYSDCIAALNPNGRYLKGNVRLSDMARAALTNATSDRSVGFAFAGERPDELLALKDMIEAGQIRAVVDGVYSYERAAEAHLRVESEARIGCVVLTPEGKT